MKETSRESRGEPASEVIEPEVVDPYREAVQLRLNRLAWILDSAIGIPGTRIRLGLDPLLGLIPGVGDLIGAAISTWILNEAAALGVPRTTLIRMSFNVGIEAIVGMIPFAGDVFDVAWKANMRNVRLLNAWLENPKRTARASRLFVVGLSVGVMAFVIGVMALSIFLAMQLVELIGG